MIEERIKLHELCEKKNIRIEGMNHFVEYYMKSLGWSESQSCKYATDLIEDGTIDDILVLGSKENKN